MTGVVDSPAFRRLAMVAASQATTACAEILERACSGPIGDHVAFDNEAIEHMADATKLTIEAAIAAGEPLDERTGQLLAALTRFVEGWR